MQARYSCIRTRFGMVSKRILMAAGLLVLPLMAKLEKSASSRTPAAASLSVDPRTTRLTRFFLSLHCPVLSMSEDFVQAADENHLDWRLLPSISVIESGGGKAYRNNNIFGWNNGLEPFPSIKAGLRTVAFRLGNSPLYRNRDVLSKLRLYNPDATYPSKVISVMNRISPVPDLTAAGHLSRSQARYAYATN